MIEGYRQIQHQ